MFGVALVIFGALGLRLEFRVDRLEQRVRELERSGDA
jgi:hypothetical protein